jgi:hypothetical protein
MPAKQPPNARPPDLAVADPSGESHDSELAAAGRQLAEDMGTSDAEEFSSPAERRAAERTARRRQRAEVHDAPADRAPRSNKSTRAPTPARSSTLLDSVPPPVLAVIAGGVLGLILGALSIGGWIIGLLVAALTVIVLQALGSHARSTRAGTK